MVSRFAASDLEVGFEFVGSHGHHLAVESVAEPLVLLDWDALVGADLNRGNLASLDVSRDRRARHAESLGGLGGGHRHIGRLGRARDT